MGPITEVLVCSSYFCKAGDRTDQVLRGGWEVWGGEEKGGQDKESEGRCAEGRLEGEPIT